MNQFHCRNRYLYLSLSLLLAASGRTFGHGGGGDIALYPHPTELKVGVGFATLDDNDEEQTFFDPSVRVFQAVLIPRTPDPSLPPALQVPYPYATDEPGFDANEGSFPALASMDVDVTELWYWDGTGGVNFQPASSIGITGGYAPMPQDVDLDGGHHSHPFFGVLGSTVPDGVFLAEAVVSIDGLQDSDPYYLVTLKDESLYTGDDDTNAANGVAVGELIRDYLDGTSTSAPVFAGTDYTYYANAVGFAQTLAVPEPTSAWLLLGAIGLWSARRKLSL